MAEQQPEAPISNALTAFFQTGMYRYSRLLARYWWILFLCGSAGLFLQAWRALTAEPEYTSVARMIVSGQVATPDSQSYIEETRHFLGTQTKLMESSEVRARAIKRVQAMQPELKPGAVQITASVEQGTSIFSLTARGDDPTYTRALLDATLDEYLAFRRDERLARTDNARSDVADELVRIERDLQAARDALIEFQRQNNLPAIEEAGNDAARYLAELNRRLAEVERESELLRLLDVDQNIERRRELAARRTVESPGTDGTADAEQGAEAPPIDLLGTENQYLRAKQQLQLLQADLEQLSKTHRPKHPKVERLNEDIGRVQELLGIYRSQAIDQIASRRRALDLEKQNLASQIEEWEQRALEVSRSKAEYERLRESAQHLSQQYANYSSFDRTMNSAGRIGNELVSIMERASPAVEIRPPFLKSLLLGLAAGLAAGALILFILDRLDDRMNSQSEFELRFRERVIGQIPQIAPDDAGRVLEPNDERHSFAEAFRNIRSSLHFMPVDGERPRIFAITSATPNEGKSTLAANLAVTMGQAGSRTLLVDADLRRGTVHQQFHAEAEPGLTEILEGRHTWQELALNTTVPNLHVLTRGRTINEAGQLFMSPAFDKLHAELLRHYDFVILDTPPVLAADDTTSLSPKIDAVLFVVRLSQTLARQSARALELLRGRQANVVGVILNCANPSMPEYKYYYQYSEYYYSGEAGKQRRTKKRKAAA